MSEQATQAGKFLYMDNSFAPAANAVSALSDDTLTEADVLRLLFDALPEADMDPVVQLSGFLTSDDPSYLPEHKGARAAATKIGGDKLLRYLLHTYRELELTRSEDRSL